MQQVQPNVPLEDVQCYNCQQMGHYATTCTSARVTRHQAAIQLLQHCTIEEATFEDEESDFDDDEDIHFSFNLTDAITLTQAHMIDPNWILLDSESTVSIFSNGKYLKNIRHCGTAKGLRIYSNGGSQDTHMIGDLPGFGTVWYNKGSLANILSLAAVRKICRVTMDTMTEAAIIVHKHNGDKMKFTESANGLYYYDVKSSSTKSSNYSFVNSVNENKSLYTRRQLKDADLAKRVYELVGRPAHATFTKMIRENQLQNCPITVDDANRALKIYGPDLAALRGKTTRTTPAHVPSNQLQPIPSEIMEAHKNVTLCFDIFFVDGLTFVATVSRSLHFLTVEHIASRAIKNVLTCIKRVNNIYKARGFKVQMTHADEEFTSMRDPLLELDGIGLNIAATNEHVPEIERAIRTIKERNRSNVSGLHFLHYPKILKKALIKQAALWLNMFPHADGVSATISPRTIVTGITANYATQCRVPIGAYCEVHNENHPSNTELARTSRAIALNPTGNLQGSYHFLSLDTGKLISRRRWTELPVTDEIIARVHELAFAERDYDPDVPDFAFEWGPDMPIDDAAINYQAQPNLPVLEGANNIHGTDNNEEEDGTEEDTSSPSAFEP